MIREETWDIESIVVNADAQAPDTSKEGHPYHLEHPHPLGQGQGGSPPGRSLGIGCPRQATPAYSSVSPGIDPLL